MWKMTRLSTVATHIPTPTLGAVVEQVEAEVHEEDLHRDHDRSRARPAGCWPLKLLFEGLAVGGPPIAGLVAQSAQDGVVHARQHRPGQNAAHGGTEHHDGQAVHQKADVHQTDDGQKAQTGEQVCKEHPAHIPAHQLEKAAYAGLAGASFSTPGPDLKSFAEGNRLMLYEYPLSLSRKTAYIAQHGFGRKRHCAGFLIINIPGFCGFCKPQSPLNVKKVFPLPFLGAECDTIETAF